LFFGWVVVWGLFGCCCGCGYWVCFHYLPQVVCWSILKQSSEKINLKYQNKAITKKKRKRLLPFHYNLITLINCSNLSHLLAPVGDRYRINEGGQLTYLKAVYYRSLNGRDNE
jgi:hypothetical protein